MKILLIGNQGQIGHEIQELAAKKNLRVHGFDFDTLDITNKTQVLSLINNTDIVINAAAYTAVDKAEDEPKQAYAVNRNGVENLALACSNHDIPLVHISTDYVFSGDKEAPYQEDDVPIPLNIYGKSKLAGEQILMDTWSKHIILRTSWVFGKYGNNFVKAILCLAKQRESLNVVGDQFGCPTAAADVARVLLEMAQQIYNGKSAWGIYHYCGAPVTTWYEFAKKIIAVNQEKLQIKSITTAEYSTRAVRPHNSELLVQKIIQNYGITRHKWLEYLYGI